MNIAALPGAASLTSIRGPLCYLVVVRHCAEPLGYGAALAEAGGLLGRAELMLDSFFILSGFLLAALYRHEFFSAASPGINPARLRQFLLQRLARFYPLHLLTLLVIGAGVLVVGLRTSNLDVSLEAFVLNLFLLHSWGFLSQLSFNFPSWSISTEWFSYLAFPLLAWPLNRLRSVPQMLLTLCGLLLLVPLFVALHPSGSWTVNMNGGILRNLIGFAIGCVLARLVEHSQYWRLPRGLTWDCIALVALPGTLLLIHLGASEFVVMIGFTLAIFALPMANGPFSRLISTPRLVWLGEISFSIYMIHAPVMMALNRLAPGLLNGSLSAALAYVLIVCAVTTLLAGVSLRYFEMPLRRMLRKVRVPAVKATRVV